jgi:hypothetical protein
MIVFAPLRETAAPRFWQMNPFELDCIDDPIEFSLKEIISQPHEYFSDNDPH